jgi:polygalacturonase
LLRCEDVILHGVRVRGDLRIKNCDGIDIDACKRVRISDCDVSCPDDAISIKACREFQSYGACEDIGKWLLLL